jgi:hypothetical protein
MPYPYKSIEKNKYRDFALNVNKKPCEKALVFR